MSKLRNDRFGEYRWVGLFHGELRWRHWALGVGISVGSWIPAEYSLHIEVGPFYGAFGIEKEYTP